MIQSTCFSAYATAATAHEIINKMESSVSVIKFYFFLLRHPKITVGYVDDANITGIVAVG